MGVHPPTNRGLPSPLNRAPVARVFFSPSRLRDPFSGYNPSDARDHANAHRSRITVVKNIRVAIVDDHEVVRYGLRSLLECEPDMVVVGEAGTGGDALRIACEHRPDVMLLDVKLVDMDGPDVCRHVLAAAPSTAVVMLTSYEQEGFVLRSLAAGAKGYMIKDVDLTALKNAIRSVARGHSVLDPKITASFIARAVPADGHFPAGPAVVKPTPLLSEAEVDIVRHLAEGLTIKDIA